MPPPYKRPGVFVEEIPTLPPSVAEVSTAVPAFLGYTEKNHGAVARVENLLEYETEFGGPPPASFTVTVSSDKKVKVKDKTIPKNLLYYAVSHYFNNGGGPCYIVSVGKHGEPKKDEFEKGLKKLEKEDEPTLIVMPDAAGLKPAEYGSLCAAALDQCGTLQDRFAIFDVPEGKVDDFRNHTGTNNLKYGAAYHPFLKTQLGVSYEDSNVSVNGEAKWSRQFGGIVVRYEGEATAPKAAVIHRDGAASFGVANDTLSITVPAGTIGTAVETAWRNWATSHDAQGFAINLHGDGSGQATANDPVALTKENGKKLSDVGAEKPEYQAAKAALAKERITLPPSAAVAGVYASVDRDRGVWKAPAGVSIRDVDETVSKITDSDQDKLNVDATSGKSINAIRAFTGKGILVWGARTLAGNDNEWRYVPVRRLFNMIEESTRKSTAFAVFEPNDATTWLKVKGLIESFLYSLWERGALAGSTPDQAYFVNVGLGKTMTTQDILEGRMNVEIGMAPVRPAEFIILKFSHKLQEA